MAERCPLSGKADIEQTSDLIPSRPSLIQEIHALHGICGVLTWKPNAKDHTICGIAGWVS